VMAMCRHFQSRKKERISLRQRNQHRWWNQVLNFLVVVKRPHWLQITVLLFTVSVSLLCVCVCVHVCVFSSSENWWNSDVWMIGWLINWLFVFVLFDWLVSWCHGITKMMKRKSLGTKWMRLRSSRHYWFGQIPTQDFERDRYRTKWGELNLTKQISEMNWNWSRIG
jgi:hypothetical protein